MNSVNIKNNKKKRLSSKHEVIWGWILLLIIGYAFIYDNSASFQNAAGYSWTRIINLPREIRMLEIVGILFLVVLLTFQSKSSSVTRLLFALCVFFIILTIVSYMNYSIASLIDFFRLTYMYILPILIYIIGREAPISSLEREKIFNFIVIWIFISAIVSWFQLLVMGYYVGDDITGLNKDAHINGNLLVFGSLMLINMSILFGSGKKLLLIIFFLITFILTSTVKTFMFLFVCFCVILLLHGRQMRIYRYYINKRFMMGLILVVVVVLIGLVSFVNIDILAYGRFEEVISTILQRPEDLSPIAAHRIGFEVLFEDTFELFFGRGPYSYANPISVGQGVTSGLLSPYAIYYLLAQPGEHGEIARITLSSGLLVEYGLLAYFIFMSMYCVITVELLRSCRSLNRRNRVYAIGLASFSVIVFLSYISALFGSIDVISLTWPLMLLMGMTSRLDNEYANSINKI